VLDEVERLVDLLARDAGGGDSEGADEAQVNVVDAQRRREAEDDDALEELAAGFMLAAAKDDKVVVEAAAVC
jgi:hypothetical protein